MIEIPFLERLFVLKRGPGLNDLLLMSLYFSHTLIKSTCLDTDIESAIIMVWNPHLMNNSHISQRINTVHPLWYVRIIHQMCVQLAAVPWRFSSIQFKQGLLFHRVLIDNGHSFKYRITKMIVAWGQPFVIFPSCIFFAGWKHVYYAGTAWKKSTKHSLLY